MPSPHSAPRNALSVAEKQARVVELIRQDYTFQQVANELGISRGYAHKLFRTGIDRIPAENVQAYREQQLADIQLAREVVKEIIASYTQNLLVGRDGDVVENGEDHGPVLAAVDRLVKLDDHEAKLLGAYAKTQIEHSGGVTYEVVGVDLGKLT